MYSLSSFSTSSLHLFDKNKIKKYLIFLLNVVLTSKNIDARQAWWLTHIIPVLWVVEIEIITWQKVHETASIDGSVACACHSSCTGNHK